MYHFLFIFQMLLYFLLVIVSLLSLLSAFIFVTNSLPPSFPPKKNDNNNTKSKNICPEKANTPIHASNVFNASFELNTALAAGASILSELPAQLLGPDLRPLLRLLAPPFGGPINEGASGKSLVPLACPIRCRAAVMPGRGN